MKKYLLLSPLCCGAVFSLIFPLLSPGEDRRPGAEGRPETKPPASGTLKEKAGKEMKEIQKGARQAGQDFRQSAKELPPQASKEFKKTGNALRESAREIKDNAKESFEEIKKVLPK